MALPGTFLGVWNLLQISAHQSHTAASTAWIQAHGHAQLFGWVGSFILGISLYILPKFRGHPLKSFALVWSIWGLWTAGVALRWWVGVEGTAWRLGLPASAILELAAYVLTQRVLVFNGTPKKKKKPEDLGTWLGIWGFASLGVALLLNLGLSIWLALDGRSPVFPPEWDRTFLILMVWGFAVVMAWGFSTKFVTIFLGLNPPQHQTARKFGIGIIALLILALARQYFLADLLILALSVLAIWALRIFHKPARSAKLVGVYRHYPAFIRLAYAWLVAGATLGVAADLVPRAAGLGGAYRHAVTVGFIALLILVIGPRMLPSFLNGRELYSTRW
ncbi:MAG: NnrS family protein, partial [Limisphaerales bacterium]